MNKFFQVSSIVDEFVFAREGAAKGFKQDLRTTRGLVICAECDLLVEVSHTVTCRHFFKSYRY